MQGVVVQGFVGCNASAWERLEMVEDFLDVWGLRLVSRVDQMHFPEVVDNDSKCQNPVLHSLV